jgi:hypothetical protein
MSDGGKGSTPRPYSVDQKTFDNNWDAIFDKKKKPDYEADDGPLTEDQLQQIKDSVKENQKSS